MERFIYLSMISKGGYVYLLTNKHHTVLYVGVTSDLYTRIYQHRNHLFKNSFTDKYNVEKLVYYDDFPQITDAIAREREIKKWRREKKDILIHEFNPDWADLWEVVKDWH